MAERMYFSRRSALRIVAAAGAALGFGASGAQAKTSKAGADYRNSPNGRQSCANCSWFEAPNGCGVVKGAVSPRGWCNLWG